MGVFLTSDSACAQNGTQTWTAPSWVLTAAQVEDYRRNQYFKDKNAQQSTSPSNQQVQALQRMSRYYMSQLTFQNTARLPKEIVDRFIAIELFAQNCTPKGRQAMMDEVLAKAPDLLTYPEPIVRTNTVLLLIQLSTEPPQFQNGREIPAVPYAPAHKLLIQILADSNQLLEARILAARGLGRIARYSGLDLGSNQRSDIAVTLVDTLSQLPILPADENWWFRYRIVESLGFVDRLDSVTRAPIVIDTLLQVLSNRQETWLLRSQAALSLSRLPFDGTTNVPLVTHEIVGLLAELAVGYEKDKPPKDPEWRHAFSRVLLSFRPANQSQAKNRHWGLLFQTERSGVGAHAAYIQQAWGKAFPVLKPVIEQDPRIERDPKGVPAAIPADAVTALKEWVSSNVPQDRRATPGSPPPAAAGATAPPQQ